MPIGNNLFLITSVMCYYCTETSPAWIAWIDSGGGKHEKNMDYMFY